MRKCDGNLTVGGAGGRRRAWRLPLFSLLSLVLILLALLILMALLILRLPLLPLLPLLLPLRLRRTALLDREGSWLANRVLAPHSASASAAPTPAFPANTIPSVSAPWRAREIASWTTPLPALLIATATLQERRRRRVRRGFRGRDGLSRRRGTLRAPRCALGTGTDSLLPFGLGHLEGRAQACRRLPGRGGFPRLDVNLGWRRHLGGCGLERVCCAL